VIHKGNGTGNNTDSLVLAVAGHRGYIGRIVINQLDRRGIKYYKIPSFHDLQPEKIERETPEGRVVLVNCAGSTLRQDQSVHHNIYINNVGSLEKLICAFANRLHSVLHMSTTHLNSPELDNEYTRAKKDSEEYLNETASRYSFEGVNLRLPTIWSIKYLKDRSLLHDIASNDLEESIGLVRFPAAIVHIAPEMSIGIQIERFLNGEREKIGYDNLNSWTGNVVQLIDLLRTRASSSSNTENELKKIYEHWRLQTFNS